MQCNTMQCNAMYHTKKVEVPMPRACIMHNGGIPDRVIANTIDILPLPHSSIRNPIQFLYFEFVYFGILVF